MGEFITIFFGPSAAAAAAVEYDKSMIVGDGSAHLSSSKLYLLTQTTWETQLEDVLKVWENILFDFYASFDRKEAIIIKDVSTYDPVTETRIYNYDIDVYLRTSFAWDKVPDDYDDTADLAEIVELEVEETISNITKIIII